MSQTSQPAPVRRLNPSAVVVLAVAAVALVAAVVARRAYLDRHDRGMFLREARARLAARQPALALGYLDRHLAGHPDDVDALDLKARVLADEARDAYQALDAIQVHTQVLGRDPDGPARQETRRRLVELNLKVGGRARTAEILARELIRRGADDARSHRLRALALEGVADEGDDKARAEAAAEYEAALRLDPGAVDVAERLARLCRDRLGDPARAARVLDGLLAADRDDPARRASAHLARARFFAGSGLPDRASAEVASGLKADSGDPALRLAAAEEAIGRGDPDDARRHLRAIPDAARGDLRVKLVAGLIELAERRPDEAIRSWRAGLLQAGGNDADLTWRLAHVLLDVGRAADAEPLIAQYRRLVGGDDPDPPCRYLVGFSLLRKGHPEEAVAELESVRYKVGKALEPHLHYLLGQCFEQARDPLNAAASYRRATVLSPRWSDPWLALARLREADRPEEAITTLEQGLSVAPDDPRLMADLALALWRQQLRRPTSRRSWGDVEALLTRGRKAAPRSVELALAEADYLATLGRDDDALARLRDASRLNPRSVPLWQARANGLRRLGRCAEALDVLDQADAAAGPEAGLVVIRASTLVDMGHVKEARAAMLAALGRVPADQQPALWKALGELALGQSDRPAARHACREWARLRPEDPGPRAVLLDLALASGDAAAIHAEVEAMQALGGPYGTVARVEELLRRPPGDGEAGRLDEAERLVGEVEREYPRLATGPLLEGRLMERRGRVDRAISAYEKAVGLKAGPAAMTPLLALLIREGRDADLGRLRARVAAMPAELDRLATVQALRAGDRDRAEQLAARAVQGDPAGVDVRVWQAQVLNELGKPREAEEAVKVLVAQHPDQPAPWLQLMMFQLARKDAAAAARTVERMRAQVRTGRPDLLWAQCYRAVGDRAQAEASYREALRRHPDDVAVRRSAIGFFEQVGRWDEAEALLRDLLRRDPALGWASRSLALILAGRPGDRAAWDEAIGLVGPSARPDDVPDDRLARARVYARGPEPGHRQEAARILEELASELPDAAAVHELLARLLRDSGQADRARAHAARAAAGAGASPEAILLHASTLLAAQALDEAGRQLDRLAAIDPEGLPVAEVRARILSARGRGDEAAGVLERAFAARADAPGGPAVGERMIALLVELGQDEAAERVARRVGRLGPGGACTLARFLAPRGRTDEAAGLIEQAGKAGDPLAAGTAALALALEPGGDPRWVAIADRLLDAASKARPGSPDPLLRLAIVRGLQGRHADRVAIYQSLLDRDPAASSFLNDMAWVLSEDLGRPEEGLERIDQAVRRLGRDAHVLDTRGVILARLGRHPAAVKDLEEAAALLPLGPFYFHLARAYRGQGREGESRRALDAARRAGLRGEQLQPSERDEWHRLMHNWEDAGQGARRDGPVGSGDGT